jgi:ParB family chromosome partitioning protein
MTTALVTHHGEIIPAGVDGDAERIGYLYRKARESIVESMRYAVEAGHALIAKQDKLKHGEWLPWLEANHDVLGFESRFTAAKLMKAAKCAVDGTFDETEAIQFSRQLWGNLAPIRGTAGTGENEWHTPPEYLAAARAVLGEFDLDPATSALAQKTVRAKKFFTQKENGLLREWHGRVWLNPPYAQPLIANFVDKLLAEFAAGHVSAAIMLTHNYTDTAWFQGAAERVNAICFTRGRVRFVGPEDEVAAPTQGQAFFYFGKKIATFAQKFGPLGFVMVPL